MNNSLGLILQHKRSEKKLPESKSKEQPLVDPDKEKVQVREFIESLFGEELKTDEDEEEELNAEEENLLVISAVKHNHANHAEQKKNGAEAPKCFIACIAVYYSVVFSTLSVIAREKIIDKRSKA